VVSSNTEPHPNLVVPEENQPGHRPDVDQDKPTGPPPTPASALPRTTTHRFRFDGLLRVPSLAFGVTPGRSEIEIGEDDLTIRFGWWSLSTPLTNVEDAIASGPFSPWKVAGPPRVSLADRGVTFATSTSGGVCISFVEPVRALLPIGLLEHPAATVTVEDPDGFIAELDAACRRARHGSS
jgi:hypothetical protein